MKMSRRGGPRSTAGKQVSRSNSLKHGLSSTKLKPDQRHRIEALTREYLEGKNDPQRKELATKLAEARIQVELVEQYQEYMLCGLLNIIESSDNANFDERKGYVEKFDFEALLTFDRYQKKVYAQWRAIVRKFDDMSLD